MEWFNGTVDDALTEYQQKKGILIVYVYAENGLFFLIWCSWGYLPAINIFVYPQKVHIDLTISNIP
uniref:Uncharacterized protein n=1 Tax=Meloidogyne incognita TaxID=6306 RepID=A0A914MY91_MELIC